MLERINSLRTQIDRVDDRILFLLKKRVNIAKKIAEVKFENGLPIRDNHREKEVLDSAASKAAREGLSPELMRRIFREIVELSTEAEKRTQ